MIKIHLQSNAREVVKSIGQFPAQMLTAVVKAMDKENELTMGFIQERKLSGPTSATTLSVRTNRLRGSIARGGPGNIYEPSQVAGTRVFSAFGTNVRYAGPLEEGFDGTVQVPGHTRKNIRAQSFKFGGKATRRKVRGADSFVRPHTRQMRILGRHYMRSGVEARVENYSVAISDAIVDAWNKGGRS